MSPRQQSLLHASIENWLDMFSQKEHRPSTDLEMQQRCKLGNGKEAVGSGRLASLMTDSSSLQLTGEIWTKYPPPILTSEIAWPLHFCSSLFLSGSSYNELSHWSRELSAVKEAPEGGEAGGCLLLTFLWWETGPSSKGDVASNSWLPRRHSRCTTWNLNITLFPIW